MNVESIIKVKLTGQEHRAMIKHTTGKVKINILRTNFYIDESGPSEITNDLGPSVKQHINKTYFGTVSIPL
jgi:hypothetical protein